jgi:hypothetical protein
MKRIFTKLTRLTYQTNNSSIISKRSVEYLYYPNEPHFFRYFVKKLQRRAPLINRGYWLRLRTIDVLVRNFLRAVRSRGRRAVVVNLGCGRYGLLNRRFRLLYCTKVDRMRIAAMSFPGNALRAIPRTAAMPSLSTSIFRI